MPVFGMLPGVASQGCREETPAVAGGTGSCLPSSRIPAFAPRPWLRLGREQEETSARKQIRRISCIPRGFWPQLTGTEPGYPAPPSLGAGGGRGPLVRRALFRAYNPATASGRNCGSSGPAVYRKSGVNIIAAPYLPCQITANRQHLRRSGGRGNGGGKGGVRRL